MNIPKFSIDNYQLTLTAFAFLLVMGLGSFLSMPQREDPALNVPNNLVTAVYPGAGPEDIESQVVDPLEEAINELDDIKEMQTFIRDGVAVTEVEFNFGTDTDEKYDELQRQLNQVRPELPEGLYALEARQITTNTVNILQIALVSDEAPYSLLKVEAERVKDMVEDIGGVKKVEIEAYPEQEVRIALNPVKMTEMNVSLDNIERAIQSNNANIPGGAVKVSNKLFNLKTSGAYDELDQIANTIVGVFEDKVVYLKNIASVYFAYEDERWLARFQGERAIFINVQQKDGYNIFDISDPVKAGIAAIDFPDQIRAEYVFDQSEGVHERVSGFLNNLLQGIILVGLIIFMLLGWRSASLVMMAIPLSILMGLWVVDQSGFALQQMSIAGLVVALGLLVDNSIAIIENIERFLKEGYSRKEAAIKGTQQLLAPMASATLTTILAFIPIVMMPEVTGAFIKALPVTVIATLAASLIVAITLTPYAASKLLKEKSGASTETATSRLLNRFIEGPYHKALNWVSAHPKTTIGLAVMSLIGALSLFPLVGVSFFPKAEKPQFRITVELPKGSNLDATEEVIDYVEDVLAERPEVKHYTSNIGHGNPRIYYNVMPKSYSSTFGEVFVVLKEYDVDDFYRVLDELRAEFGDYNNARIDIREFVQGPPSEAPIAIKIFGDELEPLEHYAREVEKIVSTIPGAINVDNPIRNKAVDLQFNINREKAMMLGVPVFAIDKTIRSFVNGTTVGTFRDKQAEDYDIVLRYTAGADFQLDDFDRLSVLSLSGRFVPLNQVANIQFRETPSLITHLDNDRTATILADLEQGYNLDDVIAPIQAQLDNMQWEGGYSYTFKGDLESRNESFGGMGMASVMALLLILGVLIIQFRSFTQPLIIFSALPLAIIGSILALLFTGISFSFTAFIGLTSLIGIAINNSIVLVDYANKLMEEGATVMEAAKRSAEVRFTPILATTLTTILGLLPLTLSGGSLWAPMGWTIIGGLLTSTTFVLLLVPVLYQLFTRADRAVSTVGA
jgi:multidrug efflux pump subunit AcrB